MTCLDGFHHHKRVMICLSEWIYCFCIFTFPIILCVTLVQPPLLLPVAQPSQHAHTTEAKQGVGCHVEQVEGEGHIIALISLSQSLMCEVGLEVKQWA